MEARMTANSTCVRLETTGTPATEKDDHAHGTMTLATRRAHAHSDHAPGETSPAAAVCKLGGQS